MKTQRIKKEMNSIFQKGYILLCYAVASVSTVLMIWHIVGIIQLFV